MGGGGVIGFPVLCLLGLYFCERRVIRLLCGVGLGVWVGGTTLLFLFRQEWLLLIFPVMVVLLWMWIDGVTKFADRL